MFYLYIVSVVAGQQRQQRKRPENHVSWYCLLLLSHLMVHLKLRRQQLKNFRFSCEQSEPCTPSNPGVDPGSKVSGGDFCKIWLSSLVTASLLWKGCSILHNTAVTKQWTTESPYTARNETIWTWRKTYSDLVWYVVFWIVQTIFNKATFVDFRGAVAQIAPLYPPLVQSLQETKSMTAIFRFSTSKLSPYLFRTWWSDTIFRSKLVFFLRWEVVNMLKTRPYFLFLRQHSIKLTAIRSVLRQILPSDTGHFQGRITSASAKVLRRQSAFYIVALKLSLRCMNGTTSMQLRRNEKPFKLNC